MVLVCRLSNFAEALETVSLLEKIDLLFVKECHRGTTIYESVLRTEVPFADKLRAKLGNYSRAVKRLRESIVESEIEPDLMMRDGGIL